MAKALDVVYVVTDPMSRGYRCIQNAPVGSGGAALTLCGWVDVDYEEELGKVPNCPDCLEIVRYCKSLKL